jgi:hypothetical protein
MFLIILLSIGCNKMMFRTAEKSFDQGITRQPYDVIIVPGFPYNGQNWDRVVKMRVHWANFLYQNGYAKNIIFSGSAVATPYIESRIMKQYAMALGVPANRIFTEEKAEHSTENIYYSFCMAREHGFAKIALATDPYQNSYMTRFVRKFELPIGFLPTVLDTLRQMQMPEPGINPATAVKDGYVRLSERENFFERFRGTMGGYIQWEERDLKTKKLRRKYKNRTLPTKETGNHKLNE